MHVVLLFLLLLLSLMVQATVFQVQPFSWVQPSLTVVMIVFVAFFRGRYPGLLLGVLLGLVQDIVYGSFIGMHTFSLGLIGYFAGSTFRMFLHRHFMLFQFTLLGYSFVYEFLNYGIARLFGSYHVDVLLVVTHALRTMIFNGIFAILLYPLASKYFPSFSKRGLGEDEL